MNSNEAPKGASFKLIPAADSPSKSSYLILETDERGGGAQDGTPAGCAILPTGFARGSTRLPMALNLAPFTARGESGPVSKKSGLSGRRRFSAPGEETDDSQAEQGYCRGLGDDDDIEAPGLEVGGLPLPRS